MEVFGGDWGVEMSDPTVQFHDTENPNFFCMDLRSFSPESRSSEATVDHSVLFSPARSKPPSSQIISFGALGSTPAPAPATPREAVRRSGQNPKEHVISERRRREKLSRRFVSLSAIVPGLKKTDKASVLEEATKYVRELQGRVKELEEKTKVRMVESVVLVKRDGGVSFTDDNSSLLPEIEAKVSEDNLLLKIHCENGRGFMFRILCELEKLNLTVLSSTILPFGHYSADVTIISKMGYEFTSTVREVLNKLKHTLSHKNGSG